MVWKFSKLQRKNKWALFDVEVYLKVHKTFVAGPVINISVLWSRNLGVTLQLDDRIMQNEYPTIRSLMPSFHKVFSCRYRSLATLELSRKTDTKQKTTVSLGRCRFMSLR